MCCLDQFFACKVRLAPFNALALFQPKHRLREVISQPFSRLFWQDKSNNSVIENILPFIKRLWQHAENLWPCILKIWDIIHLIQTIRVICSKRRSSSRPDASKSLDLPTFAEDWTRFSRCVGCGGIAKSSSQIQRFYSSTFAFWMIGNETSGLDRLRIPPTLEKWVRPELAWSGLGQLPILIERSGVSKILEWCMPYW